LGEPDAGFVDLAIADWANYILPMTETPASSYAYVGSWPATLTTAGWYVVDFYDGATIAGTLAGTFLGYWDGTTFGLGGADTRQWVGVAPLALSSQQVQSVVPITQKVDVETIKTQTISCAANAAFGAFVGNATAAVAVNGSGYVTYANSAPPTPAAIATAVWQDATGTDFNQTGSIGKSLFTTGAVPGAAGGLAIVGSLMGLADDAVTAAKFDESTSFPVKSADTGSTKIARVGADSDTLETLSDQLDTLSTIKNITIEHSSWSN
jgi:hypothetical protein